MVSPQDQALYDMYMNLRNAMHRLKVVFDFKEKIEIRKRHAFQRLSYSISRMDMKGIQKYADELRLYLDSSGDAKSSVGRAYRVAIDVLDHHVQGLRRYLGFLGKNEFTQEADRMVQIYEKTKMTIQKELLPRVTLQERAINEFRNSLSLNQYILFQTRYEEELKQQDAIIKEARIELKRALRMRKAFYKASKKYKEIKSDHQKTFLCFEMGLGILCMFTGFFVVKKALDFLHTDFISNAMFVVDSLGEKVDTYRFG